MKSINLLPLFIAVIALALTVHAQAHWGHDDAAPSTTATPNPKNLDYDSTDPTDIYAIPSDNSALDQEEELEALEAQEQKYLQKNPSR